MKNLLLTIAVLCLTGCASLGLDQKRHIKSTSLISFLYPDKDFPSENSMPHLQLPLNVGLAFIPPTSGSAEPTQAFQQQLLSQVKSEFSDKDYINKIVIIPSMYLKHGRNAIELEYLKQMFQIDVIALVSYDQITRRADNLKSLTYFTVLGAFIFKGSEFDTSTLLDLAMVDIDTKVILLRAAGVANARDDFKESHVNKKYHQLTRKNFNTAIGALSDNLKLAVNQFEFDLKHKPKESQIKVSSKPGYDMSIDLGMLLLLIFAALSVGIRRYVGQ